MTGNVQGAVGKSVPRVDAWPKVLGEARYAGDLSFPGMLHAAVLRSAYPHAAIEGIDAEEARSLPGVRAVLTARDIPGRNSCGLVVKDQPVLAGEKVRYLGDAVALVAAESTQAAAEALRRIRVTYRELPAVFDPEEALREGAPPVHAQGNLMGQRAVRKGDLARGLAQAAAVVEETYRTQLVDHAFLEPEAGVAVPEGDGIHLWVATQNPHYDRQEVAACLDWPETRVRITQTVTGGGFGGKLDISVQCHLALLARATGRPVHLVYSMPEHLVASSKRHPMRITCLLGGDAAGRLTAARVRVLADTGAYASYGPAVITRVASHCTGAYEVPNIEADVYGVYTNNTPAGAMRGFGVPQVTFAVEATLDLLARKLGLSALEVRRQNLLAPGKSLPTGQVLESSVGLSACLERVAVAAGLTGDDRERGEEGGAA